MHPTYAASNYASALSQMRKKQVPVAAIENIAHWTHVPLSSFPARRSHELEFSPKALNCAGLQGGAVRGKLK